MAETFLKIGDKAPALNLKTHKGKEVSLKDFKDKVNKVLTEYH